MFIVAPDYDKSGALKTSLLRKPPSKMVAKYRFLEPSIERKKCRINADSMRFVNEQLLTSRIKSNRILKCKKRTDFVKRILRNTKSVLLRLYILIVVIHIKCRSPPKSTFDF